jgi:hypothetical protein
MARCDLEVAGHRRFEPTLCVRDRRVGERRLGRVLEPTQPSVAEARVEAGAREQPRVERRTTPRGRLGRALVGDVRVRGLVQPAPQRGVVPQRIERGDEALAVRVEQAGLAVAHAVQVLAARARDADHAARRVFEELAVGAAERDRSIADRREADVEAVEETQVVVEARGRVPVGAQPGLGERAADRGRRHQPDRRAVGRREATRAAPVGEQLGEFARVVEVAVRAGPAEHRRVGRVVARRERRHRVELIRQHERARVPRAAALEQPVARAPQQAGCRRELPDPRAHREVAAEAGRGQRVGQV